MTDDRMDARLRAAGERWRTANTSVAEPTQPSEVDFEPLAAAPNRRRNWLAAASAAVVAVALLVAGLVIARHDGGGGGSPAEQGVRSPLVGVTWTLTDDSKASVRFHIDGTFTGKDNCDGFSGRYDVSGDRITFRSIASFLMACPRPGSPPAPSAEIYAGTVTWSVHGDRLTLTGTPVGTVSFTSSAAVGTSLTGTDWTLTGITDREGQPLDAGNGAPLLITDQGSLQANDLCNDISADVAVHAASIDIGRSSSTARGCIDPGFTPGTSEIDAMFATGTVEYSVADQTLTISKPGIGQLTYRAGVVTANDAAAIIGAWTLQSTATSGPNSASSSSAVAQSDLTVDGSGHFTLSHRCYALQGTVTTSAGMATFGDITPDPHSCPAIPNPSAQSDENNFVDGVLKGETTWTVDGDTLTITHGNHQAAFTRANSTIGSAPSDSASALPADIADLIGSRWTLEHLADASTGPSPVPATPSAALVFDFRPGSASALHLHADVTVREGTMSFPGGWIDDGVTGPGRLIPAQQDFVFSTILAGTVDWMIVRDQLIVTRGDVGAVIFRRG